MSQSSASTLKIKIHLNSNSLFLPDAHPDRVERWAAAEKAQLDFFVFKKC
jgi:hypothetical protein